MGDRRQLGGKGLRCQKPLYYWEKCAGEVCRWIVARNMTGCLKGVQGSKRIHEPSEMRGLRLGLSDERRWQKMSSRNVKTKWAAAGRSTLDSQVPRESLCILQIVKRKVLTGILNIYSKQVVETSNRCKCFSKSSTKDFFESNCKAKASP